MLIKDEATLKRHKKARKYEEHFDNLVDSSRKETRAKSLVGKITDPEKQEGRRMTTLEFMRRLRKINPDLISVPHPNKPDKCGLYLSIGNHHEYLFPMENDWMPEWSIFDTRTVRQPYDKPEGYWPTVDIPGQEIKRGWRTVLIRLVQQQIVTLEEVEREFGAGNRESWKVLTGKGKGELLI
jgi:hypothetical protein